MGRYAKSIIEVDIEDYEDEVIGWVLNERRDDVIQTLIDDDDVVSKDDYEQLEEELEDAKQANLDLAAERS